MFFLLPQKPWLWLPIVFFNPAFQAAAVVYGVFKQKINNPAARVIFLSLLETNCFSLVMQAFFFGFVFMPYRAYIAADAIVRTLFRMLISRKKAVGVADS